jgi:site-specific recombinase XerD
MSEMVVYKPPPALSAYVEGAMPGMIAAAGDAAIKRFLEFFNATIANKNTRKAYRRAVIDCIAWLEAHGINELDAIEPIHLATYFEFAGTIKSKPTVKQHLAAVRMLFDWLVTGHILQTNPATSVHAPKHIVSVGKTVVLSAEDTRALFESIDTSTLIGLRDRALIGVMAYSFARIGAVLAMRVEDYLPIGKGWFLRLHEKGGKQHEVPTHHILERYLDAYIEAAGLGAEPKAPLFCSAFKRTGTLTRNPMRQGDAYAMIRRRALKAGIAAKIGCHTFRATGITNFLERGGALEEAQKIAAHSDTSTTKLYDRRGDKITRGSIERITY